MKTDNQIYRLKENTPNSFKPICILFSVEHCVVYTSRRTRSRARIAYEARGCWVLRTVTVVVSEIYVDLVD